jgi:quercetin dioxygenase-like cupin family protein
MVDRDARTSEGAPSVIAVAGRTVREAEQTAAIRREEAFAGDDRWVGLVSGEPGAWSGWHHHAETDTYFYVLRGSVMLEYGTDGQTMRVGAGEFGHVPARLVHRERTAPGARSELVLVRIGRGPSVVNVDGPGA